MVISSRLLDDHEQVVVGTRTHVEALLLPALLLTRAGHDIQLAVSRQLHRSSRPHDHA